MLRNVCFRTHVIPSANSNFDPARGFHSTTAPFCFEAYAPTVRIGSRHFSQSVFLHVKWPARNLSILGQDWFHDFKPNIDIDNHVVHLKNSSFQANGKSLPDPLPDSRTETASLRFISGKRAVKDLRRGCDAYGFFEWVELTEPESISASKPSN